jgi:hypothetical protein
MSALYGNILLIYHDARWVLGKVLFLYIVLPLMAAWFAVGLIFDLPADVAIQISVPVYINIAIVAITGFNSLYPIAIGMGSTRVQFLKAYYGTGLGAVFFTILLLNVCQYVMLTAYNRWIVLANIVHPAVLYRADYQFIPYFWIDLMVGLFLFGFTFLIYCLWYRLGSARMLISLTVVIIGGLFLYYGGALESWFTWIWLNVNPMTAFILLGLIGLAALFSTYPLMRNAPLQPTPRKS